MLLYALVLSNTVNAAIDLPFAARCKDARDFTCCVKAFMASAGIEDDGLQNLRNATKQVECRLISVKSLDNSTDTLRPAVDQLALVESTYPNTLVVQKPRLASGLFRVLQIA